MRIISKFLDYYDCGQAYGMRDCIYLREQITIPLDNYGNPRKYWIGFCGKIYPTILGYYSFEDYEKAVEELGGPYWDFWRDKIPYHKFSRESFGQGEPGTLKCSTRYDHTLLDRKKMGDFFSQRFARHDKIFHEKKVPIFIDSSKELVLNGELSRHKFQRVFDPMSAYLELANYVGGVLGSPAKPMPKISDEIMAEIKGFDKFSFRKDKK